MGDKVDNIENISKFYSKNNKDNSVKKNNKITKSVCGFVTKVLICLIIFISLLITLKLKPELKDKIYNVVYEKNFSFAYVNNLYKKYFGSVLPFDNIVPTEEVFNEELVYEEVSLYKNGALLKVSNNYLVPILESGIVVFIGEKEDYGNTIIIQQIDGIDVWYGNVSNINIKIYDYVEKGMLLGEVNDNNLYLLFQKEGEFLNYKEHL